MTIFWSLAAGMMLLALVFIVPPLLRSQKRLDVSQDDLNTAVVKAQLGELEADLEAGKLDQAQYAAARKDLERELLYDLARPDEAAANPSTRSGRWAALLLLPAIPICAVLLYQQLGSEEIIGILQQTAASRPSPPAAGRTQPPQHSIEEMVAQLAERLRTEPDNLQGWVLLAKSYTSMGRHADAVQAYANIRRLGGDQPALLADYADALVMANGGQFTDEAGGLLEKAIELDPENLKGLWLIGHWKYRQGAYAEALNYWQRAAVKLPPGGEDARAIAQQATWARRHQRPSQRGRGRVCLLWPRALRCGPLPRLTSQIQGQRSWEVLCVIRPDAPTEVRSMCGGISCAVAAVR